MVLLIMALVRPGVDVNNDGLQDIFVSNQLGPNYLYINQGNGTFAEDPAFANMSMSSDISKGVSVADYNNDGWQDIFVSCHGGNRLFRNNLGVSFTEVTQTAGIVDSGDSFVSAWNDVNNDGWLDLFVTNYPADLGNDTYDILYMNNGDGTFTDASSDFDLSQTSKSALAVQFIDYDNDGDQDLYVVNDKNQGNTLWRNDGPAVPGCGTHWCFTDVSVSSNSNREVWGMGIAIADYDMDGDYDFYFSSIGEQVLLQNQTSQGQPVFIERSNESGLNFDSAGWATIFADFDNDGWEDAYLATFGTENQNADRVYLNAANGAFTDISATGGITNLLVTQGAAQGDLDNDGKVDMLVGNMGSHYSLYRNSVVNSHHWIKIHLNGQSPINRNAIGTRVLVRSSDGKTRMRTLTSGGSHAAGNELNLHFGLGSATITQIDVRWPDGSVTMLDDVASNQFLVIDYEAPEAVFRSGFE